MQEATIVERLREEAERTGDQDFSEAASLIERQQQVIDLLMKAVEPFAEQCDDIIERVCPEIILSVEARVMDLRRAREAKVEAEKLLNSTPSTAL